jgi:dolichyl-phosphate beta-glucosyltransferase
MTTHSIVVPAHNERARLPPTLERILAWCRAERPAFEVLVVDDGSTDGTAARVRELAASAPELQVLELGRNRGKGAAVRAGVLAARGERILFCDADLATPIEELARLDAALDRGADVAIGSRALPESDIRVRQHRGRELMGRTFNALVQLVGVRGIRDTQCGFKLFRRAVGQALFADATIERFAFDVEILWLARARGHRIDEVPIAWRHVDESKVSPGRDAARMLVDLARIRWRHRAG